MATVNLVPPLFAHLVTACDEIPQSLEPSHNRTGGFRHVHLPLPKVSAVYVMTDTSYGRSASTGCVSRCHYLAPCQ
jgi:hypothetical protein